MKSGGVKVLTTAWQHMCWCHQYLMIVDEEARREGLSEQAQVGCLDRALELADSKGAESVWFSRGQVSGMWHPQG